MKNQRFLFVLIWSLSVVIGCAQLASAKQGALFTYDGKPKAPGDLNPAQRQALHAIELEGYQKTKKMISDIVWNTYLDEEAKRQKKDRGALEKELLATKAPTEKEMKEFFDKNKKMIPYPFEKVKDQVKGWLERQRKDEKKSAMIDDVMKKKKVQVLLVKPQAPLVELRVDGFPVKGNPKAKVTIVEFADYQCPHCRKAETTIADALKQFGNKVRLVYVDYPVNRSGISKKVAEGAYCAMKQDKYWPFHEMAFANQSKLTKKSPEEFAQKLGLNLADFKKCATSKEAKAFVKRGRDEGDRVGVMGTPTIFVNGRKAAGLHGPDDLVKEIKAALNDLSH